MTSRWRNRLALLATFSVLAPAALQSDSVSVATTNTGRLDRLVTGSIPQTPGELDAPDIAGLQRGLDALSERNIAAARATRDALPSGSLDHHILAWAVAVTGGISVPSGEIAAAARELPTWPGLDTLRLNSERALFRENPDPRVVVRAFGGTAPQTAEGAIILARAHVSLSDTTSATAMLGPFWRTTKLDAGDETAILAEFGTVIKQEDHRFRMERMLYAERVKSAQRLAPFAGAAELQAAWAAVLRGDKSAAKLLAAVPASQRSTAYSFIEAKQLRRAKQYTKAAAVIEQAPRDAKALVDPDAWWVERRVLSRELMDAGEMKLAYAVASSHTAEIPSNAVDAEFHAGWYALRGLKDAKLAAGHFKRIAGLADGPISLSRAYYWLGRAAESGGPGDAKAYFAKAANYGTAFYGQLAAQRIGRTGINVPDPEPTAADRSTFRQREAIRAIERLERAGSTRLADRLYRDLGAHLTSPGELALLAAMAEKRGDHFLALKVGKSAANRGIDIGALAHPMGAIPVSANMTDAGEALAYAIARQESEFNVGAVSGAGALGLLQLMPGTAKEVAKRSGLAYSQSRLTTDAGYNATLGAAFLSEQLGRFDGSYILTFAGYNAGPKRASQWMKRYGDPRGKDIDTVVDWIERIPYTETRSYVQRVMENYQVYKMRLTGKADIVADLVHGRT